MIQQSYEGKPGRATDILVLLKRNNSHFQSSRDIAAALSITRQNVYDAISYLRSAGYEIEANRKEGYKLIKVPDNLSPVEIAAGLPCKFLGSRIYSYKSISSTNIIAQDLAKSGYPEGTLIVTDTQTKGKGRLGRKWHSPSGKGLYFSVILKPNLPPDRIAGLALVTGLAVVRAIGDITGVKTKTKWPNDVLYKSRKIAGILVEMAGDLDRIEYMVLGCGVNINHERKDFPLSLQMKAVSLRQITRKVNSRVEVLQGILKQLERLYENYLKHGFKYLSNELVENSAVIGKRITLTIGKTKVSGKAVGFDDFGRLLIKNKSGLMSYPGGEVTLR